MRTRFIVLFLYCIGLFIHLHPSTSADAAPTLTVNTVNDGIPADDGFCTLREAITAANTDTASGATIGECPAGAGTDTITFDATAFATPQIIQLTGELPDIASDMTIDGLGANLITVRRNTGGEYGIFTVTAGVIATIDGLTITNGFHSTAGATGIANFGTLTVTNSDISDNIGVFAGGIGSIGTLTVVNSTISGNTASSYGGGIFTDGTLTVINSTISGNTALGSMAEFGGGGAIFAYEGTVTIYNSTITGNTAPNVLGGEIGGVWIVADVTLYNTLLADNGEGNCYVFGTLNADADSMDDDGTCDGAISVTDAAITLPALANNGGTVMTHALEIGSPAINAGSNALLPADTYDLNGNIDTTEALPVDARGLARIGNTTVDVGAFELPQIVHVPDFVVDRSDDANVFDCTAAANDCTLRGAIGIANAVVGTDIITFDTGVFNAPTIIQLTGILPNVASPMTIDGLGANIITVRRNTGGNYRILNVFTDVTATIDGLTLTNGRSEIWSVAGGLRNAGTLTLTNTIITGNTTSADGGGIYNIGTLTVTNSVISGNTAADSGGGIYNDEGTLTVTNSDISGNTALEGGAILNSGTMTVTNSTMSDNTVDNYGGGISTYGTLTIINSTLSGNTANISGGGIYAGETLTIINSTLSGNTAPGTESYSGGGAIDAYDGTVTIYNSTITDNTAPTIASGRRGGIWIQADTTATFYNTLLADNGAGNCRIDGTLNVGVDSMSDDSSCTGATVVPDAGLVLPALANNGGSVATHALLEGSRAIGRGNNALIADDLADLDGDTNTTEDIPFDGRGAGFDRVLVGTVDIGAFESTFAAAPIPGVTVSAITPNPMQEGGTATYSIVLNAPPNAGETVRIQPRGYNGRFITVSPTQVQFTDANWDTQQIITLTAPDDPVNRGVRYQTLISHLLTTNGAAYAGITVDRLRIVISDNDLIDDQDQAYYDALNLAAWLEVTPGAIPAGTASVGATVRLNGQPMPGEVVVVNMYVGAGVIVSPSQLVFTEHNWDIPQPVTLIASAEGSTALQVVVDANSTTSPEFVGAAQAVSIQILPAGTSVTPAEQPAAPFVPAPEASAETNEGSVSE